MKLSKYFTLKEMCYSDTANRNGIDNLAQDLDVIDNLKDLCVYVLDPIRVKFGPFSPNSGFRSFKLECTLYHKRVAELKRQGGDAAVKKWFDAKQHPKGLAADIEIRGVSNRDLYTWIRKNLEFDQLILEGVTNPRDPTSGWVHVSFNKGKNRKQAFEMPNTGL